MGGARYDGIRLLNSRINYFKGYPPMEDGTWNPSVKWASNKNWHVVRHQPKAPTWAASTHGSSTVQHLVRYQLVATHRITRVVVKMTVWQCAARCSSELQTQGIEDKKKCWSCRRFSGTPQY
jgi:hypothetical protein